MFAIPTLTDLVNRARLAFRANLRGSDAWAWPNNVGPAAKVIGGAASELFGFADYIQRQKFALTADGENLDRHGAEYGLARRPAEPGLGNVTVTAVDAFVVNTGAIFQRSDGVEYVATSTVTSAGAASLTVPVEAVTDGIATNAAGGTPLALISGFSDPNGDANATAAVDANGITQGADVEADGAYYTPLPGTYRYRILFRKRNPPMGGSAADYVYWAGQVSGVTRVFVERLWSGPGTVRVFPLFDNTYPDGIGQPADMTRVANFLSTVQPAGAVVTVASPQAVPVNITIANFTPDTTTAEEAVLAELRQTLFMSGRVAGSDNYNPALPFLATPFSFPLILIAAAIVNAAGSPTGDLTAPTADIALSGGQMATLGAVTFP